VIVFLLLIVVLLIGLTAAAFLGWFGGFMADPTSSHAFTGVPAGSWSADDVDRLRFDQGLRGYRMDQVDEVVEALSARVRELEAEVDSASTTGDSASAEAGSAAAAGDSLGVSNVSSER